MQLILEMFSCYFNKFKHILYYFIINIIMKIINVIIAMFLLFYSLISFAENKKYLISWNNTFSYNIWYNNQVNWDNFNIVSLEFDRDFNWSFLIYKTVYNNWNSNEKELFKEIKINWKELKTYIYLSYDEYQFFLKDWNKEIKLNIISNKWNNNSLYLLNYWKIDQINNNVYEIKEKLDLVWIDNLYISKNNLSEKESKIIENFVFSWKNIYVTDEVFDKYFKKIIEENNLKKLEINGENNINYIAKNSYDWVNNIPVPTSEVSPNILEKSEYYVYWLWNIIKHYREDIGYYFNWKSKLNYVDIDPLLVDTVIKSKIVPFYTILSFLFLYFIFIIPVNFYIYNKKKNRFFLVYSTPIISISFLFILIFMNIYYKWTTDIENKLQINYHKDWKILSQVYIYNFTPYWWNYNISVSKDDYIKNIFSYELKPSFDYTDWNIKTIFKNVYSSSILKYNYWNVYNENNENKKFDEVFNSYSEFKSKYSKSENNINENMYYTEPNKISYTEEAYKDISKIWIMKKETDYMKKYTLWWEKNLNLEMDIYYK